MKQQNIIVKNYFGERRLSQLDGRKEMKTKISFGGGGTGLTLSFASFPSDRFLPSFRGRVSSHSFPLSNHLIRIF